MAVHSSATRAMAALLHGRVSQPQRGHAAGAFFEERAGAGVGENECADTSDQSAESAGGGLTTRLQVQVVLGEPNKIKGLEEKSKPFSLAKESFPAPFLTKSQEIKSPEPKPRAVWFHGAGQAALALSRLIMSSRLSSALLMRCVDYDSDEIVSANHISRLPPEPTSV